MGRFHQQRRSDQRRGASSLDAILVLGIVLPLVLFLWIVVPRMIQLVYELTIVTVNSPLL